MVCACVRMKPLSMPDMRQGHVRGGQTILICFIDHSIRRWWQRGGATGLQEVEELTALLSAGAEDQRTCVSGVQAGCGTNPVVTSSVGFLMKHLQQTETVTTLWRCKSHHVQMWRRHPVLVTLFEAGVCAVVTGGGGGEDLHLIRPSLMTSTPLFVSSITG